MKRCYTVNSRSGRGTRQPSLGITFFRKEKEECRNSFHVDRELREIRFTISPEGKGKGAFRFWRHTLDALKRHALSLSVSRYAHPRTAAIPRGCCTRPALMSHDCIQIPEHFFLLFFPRVRSRTPPFVSLPPVFLPPMEMTPLERDPTRSASILLLLSFSPFSMETFYLLLFDHS